MPQMPMEVPIRPGATLSCMTSGPHVVTAVSAIPSMPRDTSKTMPSGANAPITEPRTMRHVANTMILFGLMRTDNSPMAIAVTAIMSVKMDMSHEPPLADMAYCSMMAIMIVGTLYWTIAMVTPTANTERLTTRWF